MESDWETELVAFLNELSEVQDELLRVLADKRAELASPGSAGLAVLHAREAQVAARLQECQARRGELLRRAATQGAPATSLRSLASALPREQRHVLEARVRQASLRGRLLQHQSLANWVVIQRTLLHLAQLLEIIGTGGRTSPTYGKDGLQSGGALVDRAA